MPPEGGERLDECELLLPWLDSPDEPEASGV
jgi:hypothetical protein